MLAVAGLRTKLMVVIVVSASRVLRVHEAKPYSYARFFSFLHPSADLQGNGYQLLQSKIV